MRALAELIGHVVVGLAFLALFVAVIAVIMRIYCALDDHFSRVNR